MGTNPDDGDSPGYRRPLDSLLNNAGYNFDFVGSLSGGLPNDFDRDNEGHGGWSAGAPIYDPTENMYTYLPGFLSTADPDVVLLLIGTNDISEQGNSWEKTAAEVAHGIRNLLDEIYNYNPNIIIYVAKIIDRADNQYRHDKTVLTNSLLPDTINSLPVSQKQKITIVDMYTALGDYYYNNSNPNFTYGTDNLHWLHPNNAGYQVMANTWFAALQNILPASPTIDSAYATSITTNSASLNSKVNIGNQSTIVRFQWDTNNDTVWPNDQPASNSPLTSDGVGTLSISSLTPNTTYYFRSYVSNGSGTDTSIIKSFTTLPGAHSIDSAYATSITTNSASLNSKVNTGNQSTIVRFQWDTNNDTVWPNDQPASNSPLTSDGVGTLSISSLTPNTIYYFRSYVSNGSGTDTSIVKSFTTLPGAHSIDSAYATSITTNSASLNSKVNTGNQSTIVRFQWDTNNDTVWPNDQPASNSPLTSDGVGTLSISSLTPNTTYYFRSYVSNGSGTDTSIIKSFTTLPGAHSIDSAYATSITTNSASLNSKVNTGNQSTIVRFQWDTNNDAVWPNDQPASNSPLTSMEMVLNISGLSPNTIYYFRSYVSNGSGTDTSIVKSFTTIPGAPSIDSLYATSISMTSATLNSEMNTGNQSTTIRFQWDTNNDAVWANDSAASNSPLSSDGDATLGITGLLPNTTYYFRSYVSNPNGNDTSIVKSFTTVPGAPTIDSVYVTSVASDSAVLNSEMNTGNQSTTIRFQWDTNNDAIWANDQAASNSPRTTDGDALLNITGLSPNTTYYFRSYVTNATGHDTSAIKSFTTLPYAAVKAKVVFARSLCGK